MHRTLPVLSLSLSLSLCPLPVFAAGPTMAQTDAATAKAACFFAPGAIDVGTLLPAPPAPGSLVTRAELDVLLHLQAERTPAQAARARLVDSEDPFLFGSDVLGEWFSAANLPQTAAFLAQVRADLIPVSRAAKGLFNRRRPPYVDPRIKPCVEFADTGSYPSGHGMQSALWAGLLGALFPEKAAAFADRAAETRWCRLLAGVHFPSDVEAGRIVGEAIARELLKNPAVRKILVELRAEAAPYLREKAA